MLLVDEEIYNDVEVSDASDIIKSIKINLNNRDSL